MHERFRFQFLILLGKRFFMFLFKLFLRMNLSLIYQIEKQEFILSTYAGYLTFWKLLMNRSLKSILSISTGCKYRWYCPIPNLLKGYLIIMGDSQQHAYSLPLTMAHVVISIINHSTIFCNEFEFEMFPIHWVCSCLKWHKIDKNKNGKSRKEENYYST